MTRPLSRRQVSAFAGRRPLPRGGRSGYGAVATDARERVIARIAKAVFDSWSNLS
jgi:hypothetical protein